MHVADLTNDDVWGMWAMSRAMSQPIEGQAVPTALDDLFDDEPMDTIDVFIEAQGDELYLVPAAPYGGVGDVTNIGKAKGEVFRLNYLPTNIAVQASEVQGRREFGSEQLETMEYRRDRKLSKARLRLDATGRFHCASALFNGVILDADGANTLIDLNTKFGIARQTATVAVNTATNKLRGALEAAKDKSADGLGGAAEIIGWRMYCGRTFYNNLVDNEQLQSAMNRTTGGGPNAEGYGDSFEFDGIQFIKFYGAVKKTAGTAQAFIPAAEARLVPLVTDPDAYKMYRGPAPYVEAVNRLALPYYATILKQDAKGMEGEACTVCLPMPRYPRSIITVTA